MASTRRSGYSHAQIILHWVVALLIVVQIVFHEGMVAAWRALRRDEVIGASTQFMAQAHVYLGIAVGLFAVWRLALRLTRGAPQPPADEPAALRLLAAATHYLLYGLMLAMPVSGVIAWFGGLRDAGEVHELLRIPLIALVILHVAGALAHRFYFKSGVMERMVRPDTA